MSENVGYIWTVISQKMTVLIKHSFCVYAYTESYLLNKFFDAVHDMLVILQCLQCSFCNLYNLCFWYGRFYFIQWAQL